MQRSPWITLLLVVLLAVSPYGQDLLRSAFFSGEQLARSISQFLLEIMVAILIGLGLIEWLARMILARRRAKNPQPANGKMEN